jgi:hypothetical protein
MKSSTEPSSSIDKQAELQRIFDPVHLEGYIQAEQLPGTVEDEAVTATEDIDKQAELQRIFDPVNLQGYIEAEQLPGTVEDEAVTATEDGAVTAPPVIVENKRRRFLIGTALALVLVVGVILGVTIPLITNPNTDSPTEFFPSESPSEKSSIDPTQPPAQSPIKAPTAAPTACTSMDCLAEILLQNEVTDAEALQDNFSPQSLSLSWLANDELALLDLDSKPPVILVERYVLAVLYFATNGRDWSNQRNFLSSSSACEWNNGEPHNSLSLRGVACNDDDLVVTLRLCKSKHEEVVLWLSCDAVRGLASLVCMNVMLAHICLPFFLNR